MASTSSVYDHPMPPHPRTPAPGVRTQRRRGAPQLKNLASCLGAAHRRACAPHTPPPAPPLQCTYLASAKAPPWAAKAGSSAALRRERCVHTAQKRANAPNSPVLAAARAPPHPAPPRARVATHTTASLPPSPTIGATAPGRGRGPTFPRGAIFALAHLEALLRARPAGGKHTPRRGPPCGGE